MNIGIVDAQAGSFTRLCVRHLSQAGHEVRLVRSSAAARLTPLHLDDVGEWADVVLTRQVDQTLAHLSMRWRPARLVAFVGPGASLERSRMPAIRWDRVSGVLYDVEHTRGTAHARHPSLRDIPSEVVRHCAELTDLPARDAARTRIAVVGSRDAPPSAPLLAECAIAAAHLEPDIELHIVSAEHDERDRAYVEHVFARRGVAPRVYRADGAEHLPTFFQTVDWLLDLAICETGDGHGIEAMACGVRPLILDRPGAAELYPPECLFDTVADFTDRLLRPLDPARYREWVRAHFDPSRELANLEAFLRRVVETPVRRPARPSISLCMLVGAQSEPAMQQLVDRLPAALESARAAVDEVVLADTGCSAAVRGAIEDFVARCRRDGRPLVRLHAEPWQADFSLHRNQAMERATGDWVLVLDADEVLDGPTVECLAELADVPPTTDALYVEVVNLLPRGRSVFAQARLLRRGRVRYASRVHNQPMIDGDTGRLPLRIVHHGYCEPADVMAAKQRRRLEMCDRWVGEEPENAAAWSFLAQTCLQARETLPQALQAADRALELHLATDRDARLLPHVLQPLIVGCAALGRADDALRYAQMCIDANPFHPDPYYYAAVVFAKLQRWREAFDAAGTYLEMQARARTDAGRFIHAENLTAGCVDDVLTLMGRALARMERAEPGHTAEGAR